MAGNYSSNTEDLQDHRFPHTTVQVELSGLISIVLEAITLCTNILPALTVFGLKKSQMRTATDWCIGALALNDITSVAIPFGVGIPTLLNRRWLGGSLSCELYQISSLWFQINGMILVTIMSWDRFLALKRPILYRREIHKKPWRIKRAVFATFIITLVLSSLPAAGLANTNIKFPLTYCPCLLITKPQLLKEYVFPILYIALGYSTFFVVSGCNYLVIKVLSNFKERFQSTKLKIESQAFEKSSLLAFTKLIILLGALFYLTWMPVMVVLTMNLTGADINEVTAVYALSSLTVNSLIHPFAYGVFSKQFRRGYLFIITTICPFLRRYRYLSNAGYYNYKRNNFKSSKTSLKRQVFVMEKHSVVEMETVL